MYESLGTVRLSDGETVEGGVVIGPDLEWADRVEVLLGHKGEMWRWGNTVVLREELGLDVFYYILHRDGDPFVNMMNIEIDGVGLYGHVFTKPEERRNGAASGLMRPMMEHYRSRGGQALYLGTGFDSHPYHMYAKEGFIGLEDKSGQMAYYPDSETAFYDRYFAEGPMEISRLDWRHWPLSIPLFAGDFPGVARSTVMGIWGRRSTEGPMCERERRERERKAEGCGMMTAVAVNQSTGALVGLATFDAHPIWPWSAVVDVYCHPNHWDRGPEVLAMLDIQNAERHLAYCDEGFTEKERALEAVGFKSTATLGRRVAKNAERSEFIDVREWERG